MTMPNTPPTAMAKASSLYVDHKLSMGFAKVTGPARRFQGDEHPLQTGERSAMAPRARRRAAC